MIIITIIIIIMMMMIIIIIMLVEMLEDWTASYRPDLLTFVPYEWSFNIILRDFEMVWAANEHNYLECSSNKQEIGQLC